MSSINQQALASPLALADQLLVWSTANGDTRRTSLNSILGLIQASLTPVPVASTPGVPTFLPFVGGINALVASAAAGVTVPAYYTGQTFQFFPVSNNTGASSINVAALGVKNIYHNGVACTGGEMVAGAPVEITYDGVQFQIVATGSGVTRSGTEALTNKTYNGNTWTAGTGVLTLSAGKTLTQTNSITHSGTDGTVMTYPATSATLARTDAANTFTGNQTVSSLTASLPVFSDGGKVLVSNAMTGTGSVVMHTSPTLVTPTLGAALATSINFGQTTLNYYGEGTWTVTLNSFTTIGAVTKSGTYTRIGRINVAAAYIQAATSIASTTASNVTGVPFPPSANGFVVNAANITSGTSFGVGDVDTGAGGGLFVPAWGATPNQIGITGIFFS